MYTKKKIFLNREYSGLHGRVSVSFTECAQIFGECIKKKRCYITEIGTNTVNAGESKTIFFSKMAYFYYFLVAALGEILKTSDKKSK